MEAIISFYTESGARDLCFEEVILAIAGRGLEGPSSCQEATAIILGKR